jgi:ketosteroid isomerase-like protein
MRRTTERIAVAVLALAALSACQPQDDVSDGRAAADTAAVLASVDSLRSAYRQAVADGDWERLGGMVTENAVVVQPGGPARDSMLAASDAPFPPGATLEIDPWETRVLGPDWVYELGLGTVTWTPEGADGPRTLRDTYLVLLHRTADGWKVHREVASSRLLTEMEGAP